MPVVPISATVEPTAIPSVPTRIVAPAIGLDAPVVEIGWAPAADGSGTEWQLPDNAAGFQYGSALPGQKGNTVIAGHHNIKGKVFARVHELVRGDEVDLYAGGQVFHYRVDDSFILPERGMPTAQRLQNASWIAPTSDDRLTLVTCWPPNDNSYRVIVVARPE
jgi:sortase A